MTPTHSPPTDIAKDSEPFFQPTNRPVDISPVKRTGPDTDAALQRSAGKLQLHKESQEQVSSERTGPDVHASQHQLAGKLKPDPHRPRPSSSRSAGPDIVAKHQSTGKPVSDRHPSDSLPSDSDPPVTGHHSATNYPQTDLQHTDPAPTDQVPLLSLALIHHPYRLVDEIVSPVWNLKRTVNYQIDLQLNSLWRKESFQRIRSLVNLSNRLRRSRRIERP